MRNKHFLLSTLFLAFMFQSFIIFSTKGFDTHEGQKFIESRRHAQPIRRSRVHKNRIAKPDLPNIRDEHFDNAVRFKQDREQFREMQKNLPRPVKTANVDTQEKEKFVEPVIPNIELKNDFEEQKKPILEKHQDSEEIPSNIKFVKPLENQENRLRNNKIRGNANFKKDSGENERSKKLELTNEKIDERIEKAANEAKLVNQPANPPKQEDPHKVIDNVEVVSVEVLKKPVIPKKVENVEIPAIQNKNSEPEEKPEPKRFLNENEKEVKTLEKPSEAKIPKYIGKPPDSLNKAVKTMLNENNDLVIEDPKAQKKSISHSEEIVENVDLQKITDDLMKPKKEEPLAANLQNRALPQWYDDAKIGFSVSLGVYSVPAKGEWFWYKWKHSNDKDLINFMTKTQKPNFTYQDFARDFTAEDFNPDEWVELFEEAGAKYVVLTSKHHDGYTLWPSKFSFSWNSVDVGPHRDLVGEFVDAMKKKKSMKTGLYYSMYEWFDRLYLEDKSREFESNNFPHYKMVPQLKELVNTYKPELLWLDGDWEANAEYWDSNNILSWLYREAPNHETIVTNDRWGRDARKYFGDFTGLNFSPKGLQKRKFENAISIDSKSKFDDYMTIEKLIREVVTTVSSNGNILINVAPSKKGDIKPIYVDLLKKMGKWLKVNGEAIYESRPWVVASEDLNTWFTQKVEEGRINVYAMVLKYPLETNEIILKNIAQLVDDKTKVTLLGMKEPIKFERTADTFVIKLPEKRLIDLNDLTIAWTFKIDIPIKT